MYEHYLEPELLRTVNNFQNKLWENWTFERWLDSWWYSRIIVSSKAIIKSIYLVEKTERGIPWTSG